VPLAVVIFSAAVGIIVGANIWRLGPPADRRFRTPAGYTALVVTIILYITMALVTENWALMVAGWILIAGLVSASWIDLLTHTLPRQLSYAILFLGVPFITVAALLDDSPRRIGLAFGGLIMATVIVGVLYLIGRGALGAGDVRLAPTLGLYLGWHGLRAVYYGIFLGFILAAVVSLLLIVTRKFTRHDEIPMGPFLVAGTLAIFFAAAG
jgi:leader peptidase (prepilin peptidase)/N-methyltransferase